MFDITVDGGISIHAPQWGATLLDGCGLAYRAISIHAPQWGATGWILSFITQQIFQSTHPSGVRPRWSPSRPKFKHFNPRTPVGCDYWHGSVWMNIVYFNPRTPVGCDHILPTLSRENVNFNPRTPVGCDSIMVATGVRVSDFNPRTPVGCDERVDLFKGVNDLFQSTHPSGVRPG